MEQLERGELEHEYHQPISQDAKFREMAHLSVIRDRESKETITAKFSLMKTIYGIFIVIGSGACLCGNSQFANIAYTDYNLTATSLMNWFAGSAFIVIYPIIAPILIYFGRSHKEIYREAILVCGKDGFTLKSATIRIPALVIILNISNYAYYYALIFTSPTDVMAIFSASTAFVYIFSIIWLKEPFIVVRSLAVLLSIGGVVLVAYSEGLGSFKTIGVLLATASALFAAFFRIFVKKCIVNPSVGQSAMLITLIGCYSMVILWIPTLILHLTGIEVLTIASFPWEIFAIAFFYVLSVFLLCIGISITYPVYASLGSLFAIPMNAAIDVSLRQEIFNLYKILGTLSLIVAFLILIIPIETVLAFSSRLQSITARRRNRRLAPYDDQ